jgi:hypothetical protein
MVKFMEEGLMRSRVFAFGLIAIVSIIAAAGARLIAGPIPPGRQHRLTIEGENTVTFVPQAGLPPLQIDYKATIEYIVNTRFGKQTKPSAEDAPDEEPPIEKTAARSKASTSRAKAKPNKGEEP